MAKTAEKKEPIIKKVCLQGVKNLVDYMLATAYREKKDILERWLESEECEYLCFVAQKDYNFYKRLSREANKRWFENQGLREKVAREFWYVFQEAEHGQNTFGDFALPEIKKYNLSST
jgi:predicted transcriptional regulator YdeE